MESERPLGYVFAVGDTAFCCWEYDHLERNSRFLSGLDTHYYRRLARILAGHLEGDDDGTASIAIRALYHQAVETLFSLLGAFVQAPECVPAWLATCRTEDLASLVEGLRRGSPILTQTGRKNIDLESVARDVLQYAWTDESGPDSTAARFATFWRRLAAELLNETGRAEYNSIKHGLRVAPGGFHLAIGAETTPGVPAPLEAMHSMGGSRHGSTFYMVERLGEGKRSPHIRARTVTLNWSVQALCGRLDLISFSLTNIVGALRCAMGTDPATIEVVRPDRADAFEHVWNSPAVTSSSMDTVVRIDAERAPSREDLRVELERRSDG